MKELRQNPRFPNRSFPVTITLGNQNKISGQAIEPSSFGASVEISERDFEFLNQHNHWWNNEVRISISTPLNDLPACINNLKAAPAKFLVSIKLLDGHTWFS